MSAPARSDLRYPNGPEGLGLSIAPGDRAEAEAERAAVAHDRARTLARLRDDLAAIVAKTGRRIDLPERPLTIEEWQIIGTLRSVLRTGGVVQTWDSVFLDLNSMQVATLLGDHGAGYLTLGIEGGESRPFELFGTFLPFGPVRMLFRQARIADPANVVRQLSGSAEARRQIRVRFVSGPDNLMEFRFPEWGPSPTSEERENHLDAAERLVLLEPNKSQRLHDLLAQQRRRPLTAAESQELSALVDEHGMRRRERAIGLYGVREGLESDEAHRLVQASFAAAQERWKALLADPGSLEAAIRERRSQSDG